MAEKGEITKKLAGAALFLSLVIGAVAYSGWNPINLLFGPTYVSKPVHAEDSRERFKKGILPKKYPQLISYLEKNKKLNVEWISQSGEKQKQTIYLDSDKQIVIETDMFVGTKEEIASRTSRLWYVTMIDSNRDAEIDYIEYLSPEGQKHSYQNPSDEASLFSWDLALAITFKYSNCCR